MSLVAIYSVFCNGDGCVRWVGEARTAREARDFARRSGWTRIVGRQHGGKHNGGRDLCPDCAAEWARDNPDDERAVAYLARRSAGSTPDTGSTP